jgi:hypothetical protein
MILIPVINLVSNLPIEQSANISYASIIVINTPNTNP